MNQVRRLMLIVNPVAGSVKRHDVESYVRAKMRAQGYEVDVRHTVRAGHATDLAREAVKEDFYGVVVCGGDGTVNETARGLCGSSVVMGIIPLGSGNGLARHLGIPLTVAGAVKVVCEDRVLDADYATANGRPFFCTFGLGFDALVTAKFSEAGTRGLKTYLKTVLDEFLKFRSERYTIIADGRKITEEALVVACCNASQYGNNAFIAPHASIKDGLLDITLIHKGNLLTNVIAGVDILTGMIGQNALSSTFRTQSLTLLRAAEGPAHFDGEPAVMPERIEIECHPGGLRLFSTAKKHKRHVFRSPQIPYLSPMWLMLRDLGFRIVNLFR